MEIEKYKKELESAIYEGIPDGTYYIGGKVVEKVLKDAMSEALAISRVVGQSEQLKCEHKGRRKATELVEYCEDCKKILYHP